MDEDDVDEGEKKNHSEEEQDEEAVETNRARLTTRTSLRWTWILSPVTARTSGPDGAQ